MRFISLAAFFATLATLGPANAPIAAATIVHPAIIAYFFHPFAGDTYYRERDISFGQAHLQIRTYSRTAYHSAGR